MPSEKAFNRKRALRIVKFAKKFVKACKVREDTRLVCLGEGAMSPALRAGARATLLRKILAPADLLSRGEVRTLRQVVAERREEHVFGGLRLEAIRTRPRAAQHVGVLGSELQSALWPVVNAVPKAERSLGEDARVCIAG